MTLFKRLAIVGATLLFVLLIVLATVEIRKDRAANTAYEAAEQRAAEAQAKWRAEHPDWNKGAIEAAEKRRLDEIAEKKKQESIFGTVRFVKDQMRDPDSYQTINVAANADGSIVCLEYRAKNGFGGFNVGRAINIKDKVALSESYSGFNKLWKRHCN